MAAVFGADRGGRGAVQLSGTETPTERHRWTAEAALAPPPLVQVMPGDLPDLLKEDVMGLGVSGHVAGGRVRKTTTFRPPPKGKFEHRTV
ncbi:hypothetical protein fugu_015061 [Takifugu bimaculatus]|uniref:Uncharacterized protein n=1 Tax=Takifugu bimaculatus TaxID=433685 RepID=A0A4Z2BXJ8_9TELE|nr:hypothetical protein fugu_015061 [Takifugu bimaculatus]